MEKYISLIKANMSEGMSLFKVSTKKKNIFTKVLLPIALGLIIMGAMYFYADGLTAQLHTVNMEYVVLALFVLVTSLLTLVEGIYKSGNLLFNCKDDNLLFSLPIKRTTVLFVRLLKFYLFELVYNSLFLIPAMICYAIYVHPSSLYYIVSFIGLILFPIIPILISCIVGTVITFFASKFKGKNIAQTILTIIFLLVSMYLSFNLPKLIISIANNASSINGFITKIYYPAGAYIELITNFHVLKLIEFIAINFGVLVATVVLIGKVYFDINSSVKSVKIGSLKKIMK